MTSYFLFLFLLIRQTKYVVRDIVLKDHVLTKRRHR
jgi:hypothetical protein